MKHMACDFLGAVCSLVEGTVLQGKFEVSPGDLRPLPQNSKRKRVDEVFAINEVVKNKQAKSGRSYLRCGGVLEPSLVGRWEAEYMLPYLAAANRVMSGARHVSLCEDAARTPPPEGRCSVRLRRRPPAPGRFGGGGGGGSGFRISVSPSARVVIALR